MTPDQAQQRYHWIKYRPNDNTIEMYLDNFMLSGARLCEAKFHLDHLLWLKPKSIIPNLPEGKVIRKPWFFDFGEFIHWCLEQFYNNFKLYKQPPLVDEWLGKCQEKWKEMDMDGYANSIHPSDVKKYEEVKGWNGVCRLLCAYYAYYMDLRLRIIDTEITFGHNKEVKLGEFNLDLGTRPCWECNHFVDDYNIECYLTGRIDLLVDNGYKIGPIDHKTTHKFDGYEHTEFNPHDGITGYIYAINQILGRYNLADNTGRPIVCNGGWIYHISATDPPVPRDKSKTQQPRFKITPIDKSPTQLEDYKARQLSTFKRIAELVFLARVPDWNTLACNNMFFRDCEFKPIHEQPSDQWPHIINQFYEIKNPWDTRNMAHNKEQKENQNVNAKGEENK